MLPFLKDKKKIAASVIATHKANGQVETKNEEEHSTELHKHAEKLMHAVHDKNISNIADALTAIHSHLNPKASNASDKE